MIGHENCERKEIENGCLVFENVHLQSGEVCTVYLGPCGVYVIADQVMSAPSHLYCTLRNLIGSVQVRLYVLDVGLYNVRADDFDSVFSDDDLENDISVWIMDRWPLYKDSALQQMVDKLELADAVARGYKVQNDGSVYIYRHGVFKPASPHPSDINYLLALFGGILGAHRFALGKWLSGLAYLLTGGMFFVGWFLDVLFLLLGFQKDKQKRYLLPLSPQIQKFILLPIGFIFSGLLFLGYVYIAGTLLSLLQQGLTQQVQTTDPQIFQGIFNILSGTGAK